MGRIRSIHPDTCVSETMAALSDRQERTFFRLLTECDDVGRCTANARLLKGALYPLVDSITPKHIQEDLQVLAARRLLQFYRVAGKDYLVIRSWDEFQHPKNPSAPRYPDPPRELLSQGFPDPSPGLPQPYPSPTPGLTQGFPDPSPLEIGDRSKEMGEGRKEVPSPDGEGCAEPKKPGSAPTPPSPAVVTFPCTGTGAKEVTLTQAQADEWQKDFPGVQVLQELRNMRAWLIASPTKRKTARGISAFVVRWLTREQNNPRGKPRAPVNGQRSGSKTPEMDRAWEEQELAHMTFEEASNA